MTKIICLAIAVLFIATLANYGTVFAMSCGSDKDDGQSTCDHAAGSQMTECNQQATATTSTAIDTGNKICPVLGNPIDDATKATYEYEGKVYNFCCAGCIDEFKKDSEKYIKKVDEELKVESNMSGDK
nr:YHS domain-containing protein [Candidatus Omnitrophota bacterium]